MRHNFEVVGEINQSRSFSYDEEDTVNLYLSADIGSKRKIFLSPFAGKKEFKTVSFAIDKTSRINGFYSYQDFMYFVMGENLYRMDENSIILKLGPATLTTLNGPISWANNTTQIALCDGSSLYVYNITTNVLEIVSLSSNIPPNPFVVYYQDARLFLRFKNDPRIYFSDIGDFTKINDGNFEIQQSQPSVAAGLIGTNERLFVLGDVSTEIWSPPTYPTSDPIIRDNNLIYEFGCSSSASVVKGLLQEVSGGPITSFVAWLSNDPNGAGCFVLSTGGSPVRISNSSIELKIESFTIINDCFGLVYKIGASIFIEWTFPFEDKTFVYEVITKTWTRKELNNNSRSDLTAHSFFKNNHYVGTRDSNIIYLMDETLVTNDGQAINRRRDTKTLFDINGKNMKFNELIVYFESGSVGPLENPIAYLSISYDFGRNWTTPKPSPMGKIGQYNNACRWHNLGTSYQINFRIETFDPIRVFIMGAVCDYEVLRT